MGDIDKTRDRLKLDDIEEDDRRDLFNKFVDAGGEVVYDSRKKINSTTTNINANTNSHIKKNNSINLESDRIQKEIVQMKIVPITPSSPKNHLWKPSAFAGKTTVFHSLPTKKISCFSLAVCSTWRRTGR